MASQVLHWFGAMLIVVTFLLVGIATGSSAASILPQRDVSQCSADHPTAARDAAKLFPMGVGTAWIYEGLTRWTKPDSNVAEEQVLRWRAEVVKHVRSPDFEAAVLKGFPSDLAWYEPGAKPALHAVVVIHSRTVFILSPDDPRVAVLAAWKRGSPLPVFSEDLSDFTGELLFRWPLHVGQRFGDRESLQRNDGWYVWNVAQELIEPLAGVKGLGACKRGRRYQLRRQTNPDHAIVDFQPGVGIVRYVYVHHGTVSSTDLHLIEFNAPNRSRKTACVNDLATGLHNDAERDRNAVLRPAPN